MRWPRVIASDAYFSSSNNKRTRVNCWCALAGRLKPQSPTQLRLIEPGDFGAKPTRLRRRLEVPRIDRAQHERARPFPISLDSLRQPRPGIQRLRQHHRQIAQQRQVSLETLVHLLDRPRDAVSLPVALDRVIQIAHRNHHARHSAELLGHRLAPRGGPFLAREVRRGTLWNPAPPNTPLPPSSSKQ